MLVLALEGTSEELGDPTGPDSGHSAEVSLTDFPVWEEHPNVCMS